MNYRAEDQWRVLMVDDDHEDFLITRSMLKEARGRKISLEWAASYQAGAQLLRANAYDAALVDYDLGSRTGIELIREMTGQGYPAPLILYTGRGSYEVDVEAMLAGASLYLTKGETNSLLLERGIRYAIERNQAEERIRHQNAVLEGINRIFREALVCQTEEELGRVCLAIMEEVTGSKVSLIGCLDDQAPADDLAPGNPGWAVWKMAPSAGTPAGVSSDNGKLSTGFRFPEAPARALLAGHPVLTNDPAGFGVPEGQPPLQSFLGAPLIHAGQTIGIVGLGNREGGYRAVDCQAAETLAAGFVQALLQNRAEQAVRRSEASFKLLSETAGRLLASTNPLALVEELCLDVMAHLDCQAFFNYLVDEEVGRLHLNACAGLPEKETREIEWLDYGATICGCAARAGARSLAEDIFHAPDPRTALVRSFGIQAYCCHPLLAQGKVIGTLSFGTKTRASFSEEDLAVMKTVTDKVAVAMQRIQSRTALKKAHAAAENEKRRLEAVMEALPVGVAITDIRGGSLQANHAYEELWGGPRPDPQTIKDYAAYQAWWADSGKPIAPQEWASAQAVQQGKTVVGQMLEIRRFDGEHVFVHNSAAPVRDETGNIVGSVVAIQDITALRQAEEAAHRNEAMLRFVLDQVPSGVTVREARTGALLLTNTRSREIMGTLAENTEELAHYHGLHPDGRRYQTEEWPLSRSLSAGEVVEAEEIIYKRSDGALLTLNFSSTPIHDAQGQVMTVVSVIQDLTERVQAEQAQREANALLQEQAEELEVQTKELQAQTEELLAANELILARENELRLIMDATPALISYVDTRYCYRRVNQGYERWFGCPAGEIQGKFAWEVMGQAAFQAVRPNLERALAGEVVTYEVEMPYRDGGTRWVRTTLTPDRDREGAVKGYVGHIVDISEIKQAEKALRASEAQYRELVQNANSAIIRWSRDGTLTFFNEYAQAFFGWSAEEALGRRVDFLVPEQESTGADLTGLVQDIVDHPEDFLNNVNENLCRDGRRVWMTWTNRAIRDESGLVSEILAIGSDITERIRAEKALRESEEKFRSAVAHAAIGFAMTLPEGRYVDANPAYCLLTGYSMEELLSADFPRLIYPDDYAANMRLVERVLAGEMADFVIENRYVRKDGGVVWVRKSVSLVRNAEGAPRWLTALVEDISERKRAEEALLAQTDQLKRSNQALEDFASIASHDLQEPLRKIQLFGDRLQAISSQALGEEGRDYIQRMQQAAGRMQEMLAGLLSYSRISSQGRPFTPVDLQQVVRDVLSDLEARLVQSAGQVEVDPLPVIEADPLQIRQLFQNLLGNALKFHRPGVPPRVKISCSPAPENAIILAFADNGIGLEAQRANYLFQPFHRLHGKSEYEGTGMGLAICRKIVERHAGSLTVDSQPGVGTTFLVTLPVASFR